MGRVRIRLVIFHLWVFSYGFESVCDCSLNMLIKTIPVHSLIIMVQNRSEVHASKTDSSNACYLTVINAVCFVGRLLWGVGGDQIRLQFSTEY